MNKKLIFLLISICLLVTGCSNKPNHQSLYEEILTEQTEAVKNLIQVAHKIDSDDASYWAYETADSILNTISHEGSFYIQQSKVYSALTYVFFGMSYTKSNLCGPEALERTSQCITYPLSSSTPEDSIMLCASIIERLSISASLNFYLLSKIESSDIESAQNLIEIEDRFDDIMINEISEYSGDYSKFILLKNKNLFCKAFATLIFDCDATINDGEIDNELFDEMISLAKEQDKILADDIEEVCSLSEDDFLEILHKSTHIQSRHIQILADRISKLPGSH